jgi:membrane fusion protein (multidrug efflux system)
MAVEREQLLARIDDDEYRARLEISRVALKENRLAYDRARELRKERLISTEEYDRAKAGFESAQAEFDGNEILLGYTEVRAPFDGLIVRRYIDFAETVAVNTAMFRISDFTPLLCPIQVPERELPRLRIGQRAYLTVESWPGERFDSEVLRISPVVDAETGTIKVTLEVEGRDRLRPGMFARVYVETETRADALVIPKAALSLDSIGDTVYVADGDAASRREVVLGFREGDSVEVLDGVVEGERVVVVGQDGLSEGTPIQVLREDGEPVDAPAEARRP